MSFKSYRYRLYFAGSSYTKIESQKFQSTALQFWTDFRC